MCVVLDEVNIWQSALSTLSAAGYANDVQNIALLRKYAVRNANNSLDVIASQNIVLRMLARHKNESKSGSGSDMFLETEWHKKENNKQKHHGRTLIRNVKNTINNFRNSTPIHLELDDDDDDETKDEEDMREIDVESDENENAVML